MITKYLHGKLCNPVVGEFRLELKKKSEHLVPLIKLYFDGRISGFEAVRRGGTPNHDPVGHGRVRFTYLRRYIIRVANFGRTQQVMVIRTGGRCIRALHFDEHTRQVITTGHSCNLRVCVCIVCP